MTVDDRRTMWRENSRRYRERHPERIRENSRAAYRKDPKRAMSRTQRWRNSLNGDPERKEQRRVKDNAMARKAHATRRLRRDHERNGGRTRPESCDLCDGGGRIYFDHCHQSGAFRGWLCIHCNLVLGHVRDDPALLRKLAGYLEAA